MEDVRVQPVDNLDIKGGVKLHSLLQTSHSINFDPLCQLQLRHVPITSAGCQW